MTQVTYITQIGGTHVLFQGKAWRYGELPVPGYNLPSWLFGIFQSFAWPKPILMLMSAASDAGSIPWRL